MTTLRDMQQTIDHLFSEQAVIDALDRADTALLKASIAANNATTKLCEKINNVLVGIIGNRVTVLGYSLCATPLVMYHTSTPWEKTITNMLTGPFLAAGYILAMGTMCGWTTYEHYKKAADHIKSTGKLDMRYAETLITRSENRSFVGYCQQQGLYLAARDYGYLDVFEKARKMHSNVKIPHF
jgi:hypothetical protein